MLKRFLQAMCQIEIEKPLLGRKIYKGTLAPLRGLGAQPKAISNFQIFNLIFEVVTNHLKLRLT